MSTGSIYTAAVALGSAEVTMKDRIVALRYHLQMSVVCFTFGMLSLTMEDCALSKHLSNVICRDYSVFDEAGDHFFLGMRIQVGSGQSSNSSVPHRK